MFNFWPFKKRATFIPRPHRCICGAEWVSDHWDAMFTDGIGTIYGITCPTPGCAGNIKDQHQKAIELCQRGIRRP